MIKEAIDKILDLAVAEQYDLNGKLYTNKPIVPIKEPEPDYLRLYTLTGLVDYVKTNGDVLVLDELIIHVENYDSVWLLSTLVPPFQQRLRYISTVTSDSGFSFSTWLDVETFVINIQSQFVQDAATAEILKLVGNLKDENVRTVVDDGITQNVAAKVGVARVNDVDVPNPVTLRPYRTFLEIEQPASQFVFRLRRGREGQLPSCALFEADGGKWKLEAIERIRDYLKEKLPDITIIA